jgi:hypothetical protein
VQAAIQDKQVRVTGKSRGRSAGSDSAGSGRQAGAAAAVHELPGLKELRGFFDTHSLLPPTDIKPRCAASLLLTRIRRTT